MTLQIHRLHGAILAALAASPLALAVAQDARAQDAEPAGQPTTLDRIEVTGSRIPRAEIENEQPIITISRAQIEEQGFNSVADILQNLTSSGSPAISRSMALSSGEDVGGYFVDLRNLGPQRTLVLLNGKRLGVSSAGLQDLGQVPMSAIERIEVLKDGASSNYGSDAIAGVINVITRRNFEGAEFNGYVGAFDEGEAKQNYSLTMGASNDRGGVTISAEYAKDDPVYGKDREFSKYGNSPDIPYDGWSLVSQNGVWIGPLGADGAPVGGPCPSGYCTLDRGTDPRNPANYHDLTLAERANANEQMMVQTGVERKSLFVSGFYDISDSIRFTTDIGYNRRTTDQQIAGYPGQYYYGLISADSYFNPSPGDDQAWFRRFWEVPRTTENQLDTFRVTLGLEGTLEFGEDRLWNWDVGFLSNENTNNKQNHGDAYLPALQAAIGPSFYNAETGRVECGTAADPIAYGGALGAGECIPFNPLLPFGEAGDGSLANPTLQQFLFPEYHDHGTTRTTDYTANLAGTLFSLPAGDLGLAVGVEHRREQGRFVPDAVNQVGQSTGLPATTTAGSYDLDEAYVELEIPVLADVPGARELTFNVASRYSDYSNFGNTVNNKFQMRWRPMDGLLVRATYAEGFRAPSIEDLYGGTGGTYAFYIDPCQAGYAGAGNARCAQDGVPADYVQLGQGNIPCTAVPCQTNNQFVTGSNPDLTAELAESKTAGIVWSPKWVDGLDFTLDWYKVTIDSAIVAESPTTILNDCYLNNIESRCATIQRSANNHSVTSIFLGLRNIGTIETEGYDLGVNYRLPEFAIGQFNLKWQTSYTSVFDQRADQEPDTRYVGFVGTPGVFRVRSNFGLDWSRGDYSLSYMARYYSGMKEECASDPRKPCSDPDHVDVYGNPQPQNRTGSNVFHDLQFAVKLPWNATASLGANNIFDHMGPQMYSQPNSSFAYYGGFDIGRFWYLKYQQRF
ncbi:TonB-dependent receptor plug domain-containing protein [Luteimonas lutimaris]|uniref:TonB-dependent receptor n=1 Tax=Luteimonas lutimaris TaxID=698645 RepID=A0ABP7M7P4_9GAMM